MYLMLIPERNGIRYGATTEEAELIYDGFCPLDTWNPRHVTARFHEDILLKIRSHGRVFSHIGILIPYAPIEYTTPMPAAPQIIKHIGTSSLVRSIIEPVSHVLNAATKAWPHLPRYFLFDTCLSESINRKNAHLLFPYDTQKQASFTPVLLHSYGHQANLKHYKGSQAIMSLYIGDHVSLAVLEEEKVEDAIFSYSPLGAIPSFFDSGMFDPGFYLELAEKKRWPDLATLFTGQSGLVPAVETSHDLTTLLEISGMIPRKKHSESIDLPIESVQWIEESVKSFIRTLRQSIGALMATNDQVKTLLINTSVIPESSPLWQLVTAGSIGRLQCKPCSTSLLTAACGDLAAVTHHA